VGGLFLGSGAKAGLDTARWPGMALAGAVSQVVKTAQSRGRTERTLPTAVISGLRRRRSDINQFWCHITVCDRREVMPLSADDFREAVADARKKRFGAKAPVVASTALMFNCLPPR
jgi:hypothetical protein